MAENHIAYHPPRSEAFYDTKPGHVISVTGPKAAEISAWIEEYTEAEREFPPIAEPIHKYARFRIPNNKTIDEVRLTLFGAKMRWHEEEIKYVQFE